MEKLFDVGTLPLFLVFFFPGFISLKMYDLLVPSERRDFSKAFLDAVAFSTLNFGLLWWLVRLALSEGFSVHHPVAEVALIFLVLLLFPAAWPVVWVRVLHPRFFRRHFVHPHDRAWDYVFSRREPLWIILHLTDRRRIGGWFGSKPFASSNPAEAQIYLEQVWELDDEGKFVKAVDSTRGVLILEKELLGVEFFSDN